MLTGQPALVEALERKDLFGEDTKVLNAKNVYQRRRRALVPGCGRGYDVLLLAAFGYDAYGLESSELALEDAKTLQCKIETVLDGKNSDGVLTEEEKSEGRKAEMYRTRNVDVGRGHVNWITGDFFKDEWVQKQKEEDPEFDGTFEVLYDYTVSKVLYPSLLFHHSCQGLVSNLISNFRSS